MPFELIHDVRPLHDGVEEMLFLSNGAAGCVLSPAGQARFPQHMQSLYANLWPQAIPVAEGEDRSTEKGTEGRAANLVSRTEIGKTLFRLWRNISSGGHGMGPRSRYQGRQYFRVAETRIPSLARTGDREVPIGLCELPRGPHIRAQRSDSRRVACATLSHSHTTEFLGAAR